MNEEKELVNRAMHTYESLNEMPLNKLLKLKAEEQERIDNAEKIRQDLIKQIMVLQEADDLLSLRKKQGKNQVSK